MNRLPRWASALPVMAILLLSACKPGADTKAVDAAASALAVSTSPAIRRQVASGLTVSGPVSAVEEMQLGVEASGLRVTAVHVEVGQSVRAGQALLTLDHRMLDAQLAQAQANLRQAEAGAALARSNLQRGEQLAQGRYISAQQLDQLRAARVQADAQVGTARAARDTAALQRSFADLRAPAAGIVSKRLVQAGQVVGAGQELLRLIRDGRLEWRVELPAEQLAQVKPGDRIRLQTAAGQAIEGLVRAVSPGVDAATRTGTLYADLPQPGTLQPGTFLEGRIETGVVDALVIPRAAIVQRDGHATVFVLQPDGRVKQVAVTPGANAGDAVQIVQGLSDGQQVVLEGAGFLADGDKVRVVPASTSGSAAARP